MASIRQLLGRLCRNEDVLAISRRYFISNGFDGTLTCIGIVVGAVLSGVPAGGTIIKIGLGAAIGLATSAVWSVWEIERAETSAQITRLEQAMLRDLADTQIERQKQGARAFHATMSGLGPIIGILIPLTPFLFEDVFLTLGEAALIAVSLGIAILCVFGAYMGSISGQRWYVAAARMGLAGVVVAILNVFLPG